MELFDGTEYVDERVFEDSEELSDDEDSNAEGYYDHLLDSWSDDDGRDWITVQATTVTAIITTTVLKNRIAGARTLGTGIIMMAIIAMSNDSTG